MYLYYGIGNGQPREPALCQLYRHTFVPYSSPGTKNQRLGLARMVAWSIGLTSVVRPVRRAACCCGCCWQGMSRWAAEVGWQGDGCHWQRIHPASRLAARPMTVSSTFRLVACRCTDHSAILPLALPCQLDALRRFRASWSVLELCL